MSYENEYGQHVASDGTVWGAASDAKYQEEKASGGSKSGGGGGGDIAGGLSGFVLTFYHLGRLFYYLFRNPNTYPIMFPIILGVIGLFFGGIGVVPGVAGGLVLGIVLKKKIRAKRAMAKEQNEQAAKARADEVANLLANGTAEEMNDRADAAVDEEDYATSIPLFQKAAEMGHARACGSLGFAYLQGEGVEQDSAQCVKWLEKALALGLPDESARILEGTLGRMYRDGNGVPQNKEKAKRLFKSAADKGDEDAQEDLEELE